MKRTTPALGRLFTIRPTLTLELDQQTRLLHPTFHHPLTPLHGAQFFSFFAESLL